MPTGRWECVRKQATLVHVATPHTIEHFLFDTAIGARLPKVCTKTCEQGGGKWLGDTMLSCRPGVKQMPRPSRTLFQTTPE